METFHKQVLKHLLKLLFGGTGRHGCIDVIERLPRRSRSQRLQPAQTISSQERGASLNQLFNPLTQITFHRNDLKNVVPLLANVPTKTARSR